MRRCFTLLLAAIVFATTACDEKASEEIADVILLSHSSVAFAEGGGTTAVSVACPSAWKASCPDSWVELTPEAELLRIAAAANTSAELRETTITIESAADRCEITVRQGYTEESIRLDLTASGPIAFDSEGESFLFTVETNGTWEASTDASWITIETDRQTSTLRISASRNEGDSRSGTLTVTAVRNGLSERHSLDLEQVSRAENPYYNLLGYYGLYASNWYYGGQPLGVAGTGTFCTIEEKEYRKSVYIKDLFIKGTVNEARFDPETGSLTIELGKLCLTRYVMSGTTPVERYHYIMVMNMGSGKLYSGTLTGTPGEGYNDDADQMRKAILLSGMAEGYSTLGIIGYQQRQYISFADVYYATGDMYLVAWDRPDTQADAETDVTRAAAGMRSEAFNVINR